MQFHSYKVSLNKGIITEYFMEWNRKKSIYINELINNNENIKLYICIAII